MNQSNHDSTQSIHDSTDSLHSLHAWLARLALAAIGREIQTFRFPPSLTINSVRLPTVHSILCEEIQEKVNGNGTIVVASNLVS